MGTSILKEASLADLGPGAGRWAKFFDAIDIHLRSICGYDDGLEWSMTHAVFNTSEGSFKVRLFDQDVPNTVANFVDLAEGTKEFTDPKTGQKTKRPFYDGLVFHRVIE